MTPLPFLTYLLTCPICNKPFLSGEYIEYNKYRIRHNDHDVVAEVLDKHTWDIVSGGWDTGSIRAKVYMLLKLGGKYYMVSYRSHTLTDLGDIYGSDIDVEEEIRKLDEESLTVEEVDAENDFEAIEKFRELIEYW